MNDRFLLTKETVLLPTPPITIEEIAVLMFLVFCSSVAIAIAFGISEN